VLPPIRLGCSPLPSPPQNTVSATLKSPCIGQWKAVASPVREALVLRICRLGMRLS
jgi:hypothetical protein